MIFAPVIKGSLVLAIFAEAATSLRIVVIIVDHRLFDRRCTGAKSASKASASPSTAATESAMHERFNALECQRAGGNPRRRRSGAAQEASRRAGSGFNIYRSTGILRRNRLIRHLLVLRLRRRRRRIAMAKQPAEKARRTRRRRLQLRLLYLIDLRTCLVQREILHQHRLG